MNVKLFLSLLVCIVLVQGYGFCQKLSTTVSYDNSSAVIEFKKIRIRNYKRNRFYYSLLSHEIVQIKSGGYDKKLHGKCYTYYRNKNLKSSGNYRRGLQVGTWKFWFDNGELSEIRNFKKGQLSGKQEFFNPKGNNIAVSRYKRGLLHGDSLTLSNATRIKTSNKYKKGVLLNPTDNLSLWDKAFKKLQNKEKSEALKKTKKPAKKSTIKRKIEREESNRKKKNPINTEKRQKPPKLRTDKNNFSKIRTWFKKENED